MEHKGLTYSMIARNRDRFRRHVYPNQRMSQDQLVDLSAWPTDRPVIAVDCSAELYQAQYPSHSIKRVEGVFSCKNFAYDLKTIDHMFDDKVFERVRFPAMSYPGSLLLLDHSLFIKYRSGAELAELFAHMTDRIEPDLVIVRHHSYAFDEYRFGNRLAELLEMIPAGYVMVSVLFDEELLDLRFQRRKDMQL